MTLLAILVLSVSMGIAISSFSFINGMILKPLPFPQSENLKFISLSNTPDKDELSRQMSFSPISFESFEILQSVDGFESLHGYFAGTVNVSGNGSPERYDGAFISTNFLDTLRIEPILGSSFSGEPDLQKSKPEILISYNIWSKQFNSDPKIIGRELRVNGSIRTVVGVLPDGFNYPIKQDIWIPIEEGIENNLGSDAISVYVVARINPTVSARELQEDFEAKIALSNHLKNEADASPLLPATMQLELSSFSSLLINPTSQYYMLLNLCGVVIILFVACANVANLLVGRSLTRGKEIAIRSALGATRGRIIRQLLTESLVLSVLGTIGGSLYAAWAIDATYESSLWQLPFWIKFDPDWRVVVFISLQSLFAPVVYGLIPAWQASRVDLNTMLKDSTHSATSFRLGKSTKILAVIQIAFACSLLFAAGLMVRHVYSMANAPLGYDAQSILTMRMGLFAKDYPDESDKDDFYAALNEKVSVIPGIDAAAVSTWIGQYGNFQVRFRIEEESADSHLKTFAFLESVSPDYFSVFDMPVKEGRTFMSEDQSDSTKVIIVNQAFVDTYLADSSTDVIGKKMRLFLTPKTASENHESSIYQIIGVVPNAKVSNFLQKSQFDPIIYTCYTQSNSNFMTLLTRMNSYNSEAVAKAIKQEILKIDPHLPVYFTMTMDEVVDEQLLPYRVVADFFIFVGSMALFLASIGVYGMIAFNVNRRSKELGIRMALGANSRSIVRYVISQGVFQIILGICFGTIMAYGIGIIANRFISEIDPADLSIYSSVVLILISVATLAFFVPARRAAKLSPMEAMRYE